MQLVVDTNVVVSALLRAGETRKLLLSHRFDVFSPEYVRFEIQKHRPEFIKKMGSNDHDFEEALGLVFEPITVIPLEEYAPFKLRAEKLARADLDDWPFLALALKLNCEIWSNDMHLKKQSDIRVFSTSELRNSKEEQDTEQQKIREEALQELEKGYPMGKILYKHRSELYEREKNIET